MRLPFAAFHSNGRNGPVVAPRVTKDSKQENGPMLAPTKYLLKLKSEYVMAEVSYGSWRPYSQL